nr:MAG: ORF1 [Anelloviridae sp.]
MAWRWWWQRRWRRRPWPRRRWRRLRRRRPRRPVRRRRRRATVRRRRWRGRRGRRTYTRRAVRRRRRPRKRLVLTQWSPQTVRNCSIRGIVPMVICGHTKGGRNYAIHSEDFITQIQPFGGSFSTTTWSLKVLWDEHQKFHNRWSYPNTQLDLARYRGVTFWFYRDQKTDYIVQWSRNPPFKLNKYSSSMYHPGMMMQAKKKLVVPSFQTRPKGKKRYRVRIRPPNMFADKWYTQEDLCPVPLVQIVVSAASLLHPFCPPQTNNPCITFQVLKDIYDNCIGVNSTQAETYSTLQDKLYTNCTYFETTQVLAQLSPHFQPALKATTTTSKSNPTTTTLGNYEPQLKTTGTFYTGNNPVFGMCKYKPTKDILKQANKWFWDNLMHHNDLHSSYGKANLQCMEYHTGIYSSIFLSPQRSLEFPAAYQDVTYNPNCDRAAGNRVWFQYSTKMSTDFDATQCKCVLENIPLWAAFHGYADFIEQELSISSEIRNFGIVCFQCPYTFPPCFNKQKPNKGYVFYDTTFGNGKMPDGSGHIPIYWQQRWWIRLAFQVQVMHDFVLCGPFSYKDDLANTTLTARYKFRFKWGGNIIPEQIIKNPCQREQSLASYPDRQRRDLQVVDPSTMGPIYTFHTWDWRRGLFGADAIQRVSQKPEDAVRFTNPFKRPRYLPPTDGEDYRQEDDFALQEKRQRTSTEEVQDEESPPQNAPLLQQQQQQRELSVQLAEQQRLGVQLRYILQEVLKTQAGLHLNPLLLGPPQTRCISLSPPEAYSP